MASSSTRKFKAICVIGSSVNGRDDEFLKAAQRLGKSLAKRKLHLVYEGGVLGLSGMVAMTAIIRGSQVLGVPLANPNIPNDSKFCLGSEWRAPNSQERLKCMLHNADAFIALPGGLDTLELITMIISSANSNHHQKPIGFLNVNGFYNTLISFLNHAAGQGFVLETTRCLIRSTSNADQLLDQLLGPAPPAPPVPVPVIPNDNSELETDLRLALPAYRLP